MYVYVHICVYGGSKRLVLEWVCSLIANHLICCVMVSHLNPQTIHVAGQFALELLVPLIIRIKITHTAYLMLIFCLFDM